MFKITLTLVALAAFQGAFASPIPQAGNTVNALTNALGGVAGSLSGAPLDLSTGRRQEDGGLDDGEGDDSGLLGLRKRQVGVPVVGSALSGLPVVGGLTGGITGGSVGSGLLKRQLDGAGLPVVGSTLNGLPVVGPIIGGATGGSIASGLLKKRQLAGIPIPSQVGSLFEAGAPVIGPILSDLTGAVGAVPGLADVGNAVSVLKRQDANFDPLSLVSGLGGLEGSNADLTSLENVVPGSD